MAITWTAVTGDYVEWASIRAILAEAIDQCVEEGTRIHKDWIYEIDPTTMLGKVTSNLRINEGPNKGKIHAWTIGVRNVQPMIGIDGETNIIGGQGRQWHTMITFDIWGFWANEQTPDIQQMAENEARLVQAFFKRNAPNIVAATPGITRVLPLSYNGPQTQPFSDGTNVIVASGGMQVEVIEALTS